MRVRSEAQVTFTVDLDRTEYFRVPGCPGLIEVHRVKGFTDAKGDPVFYGYGVEVDADGTPTLRKRDTALAAVAIPEPVLQEIRAAVLGSAAGLPRLVAPATFPALVAVPGPAGRIHRSKP